MPTFGFGKVNGVDRNPSKHVILPVNSASISTTQSKWGGSSLYLPGAYSGAEVQAGPSPFTGSITVDTSIMSGGDFTVEMWIYPTTLALNTGGSSGNYYPNFAGDFNQDSTSGGFNRGWTFGYNGTTLAFSNGGVGTYTPSSGSAPSLNAWNHIYVQRNGTTLYFGLNGLNRSSTNYVNWTTYSDAPIRIGHTFDDVHNDSYTGYINDFRMSNIARYSTTGFYTQPTAQFTPDSNTIVLAHFNGPSGSTSFEDSAVF